MTFIAFSNIFQIIEEHLSEKLINILMIQLTGPKIVEFTET